MLYFARHGKIILNTVWRSQGWIDAPLTPVGVKVAESEVGTLSEYNLLMKEKGFYQNSKEFADSLWNLDKDKSEEGQKWPAEDSQTIVKRLMASLDSIVKAAEKEGQQQILVVSHGMSIITILGELDEQVEIPARGLENASICKVTYKAGEYKIESVNSLNCSEKGKLD